MKHVKKALAWMLVLCMVLTMAPVSVSAAEAVPDTDTSVTETVSEESEDMVVSTVLEETGTAEASETLEETRAEESTGIPEEETAETLPADNAESEESESVLDAQSLDEENEEISMASIDKNRSVPLNTNEFYRIFHLDCGRKYFSVEKIKSIIDVMADNDYNALELALGNDGLRFLLDDMSVTANDTTYTSDSVKTAVREGNRQYCDDGANELTQSEMDAIIAYANEKNISVIPLINTPGHMDAILNAASTVTGVDCSYNGSGRTIDVTNAQAVNFTMAFVNKYIEYFAGKGCTIFNMGCDEYANDIYSNGSMGFGQLVNEGNYNVFIEYVNNMAAQVQNAGMTAMAFNDGFYFNGNTGAGSFDTNIVIAFWSSGWSGYKSMSAADLQAKGHQIINTNGDWYYILGKDITSVVDNISKVPYNDVMGSGAMDVAGSMVCFWCDTPGLDYTDTEVSNVTTQIRTFAAKNSAVFDVEQEEETSVVTDASTKISVTAPGLTGLTVSEATAPAIDGAAQAVAYDVKPETANGIYTEAGVVAMPIPDGWDTSRISAFVVNADSTITKIDEVSVSDNTATFTAPHFSVMGLMENKAVNAAEKNETINVAKGSSKKIEISGANYDGTYTTDNVQIATVEVTGTDAKDESVKYEESKVSCNTLINANFDSWQKCEGYYYKTGDQYYQLYAKRSSSVLFWTTYTYTWGYSVTDSANGVTQIGGTQSAYDTSDSPDITVYEQINTGAVPAATTITFKGVSEGTTYVTIGDTRYTINVIGEDLSKVSPLSIEYWITNGRPVDTSDSNKCDVSAAAANVYSEEGSDVGTLLPANTTKENRELQYWLCRLLDTTKSNSSTSGTERQTETAGDDETYNGTGFTKVRYWNEKWSVYTENNEWVDITSAHQLVAYYLEILPVADELVVTAADWGKKGDGTTGGDYLEPQNSCTVSVQVVYEDGTTNPATTNASDLRSRTIAYGYWTSGRGVGTLNLTGLEGYQIWKVEAETGSETYANSSSAWGSYTVNSFSWDNNAMTVYEGEPVDSYIIHNDAHYPSKEGYYENLQWDENHEAILITVYVKAKPTEDTLKVVYFDEKFNTELYSYNINVKNGVNFDSITPVPGTFTGNEERIDVTGCGIENSLGVTQKFQTDLTQVPEAVGKYDSELYSYTGSEISADKKTLTLYYNINTTVLKPMLVADFGHSITFSLSQVVGSNSLGLVESVSAGKGTYGELSYDSDSKEFTYKPTKVLQGIDILAIGIQFAGESGYTITNAGVMPATTVNYEEGFAALTGFTDDSTGDGNQKMQIAGESSDVYGYDEYVAGQANTCAVSNAKGSTAAFDFTGTGVDLYVNSTEASGNIVVQVRNSSGGLVKLVTVKTTSESTITGGYSKTDQDGLIAASVRGLTHGKYSVKIVATSASPVYFDGFRVYGTLLDQSNEYYVADKEDNPTFLELRDYVLTSLNVDNAKDSADAYAQIREKTDGTLTGVVLDNGQPGYDGDALLENGPKNELFLMPGQSVVFKLTTNRVVQVGLKAVNGSVNVEGNYTGTISTSTDMFYTVIQKADTESEKTITITNASGSQGILSVTKVKICDDPNAGFGELMADDLDDALTTLGVTDSEVTEPEESEKPAETEAAYADAALTVKVNEAGTVLTKNGVAGEPAVFTAAEIEEAAKALVAEGYELTDAVYSDVTVVYGESDEVSFTADKQQQTAAPDEGNDNTSSGFLGFLGGLWKTITGWFGRR